MIGGNEEVFRFQEGSVLFFAVASVTGTDQEVIDNISPSSTAEVTGR